MLVYADETGNSGRNIFDENEFFRLGAILTVGDIAPSVGASVKPFLAKKGVERVHAHEWPEDDIAHLGHEILDAINGVGPWAFNLTEIHKPYMAPTKFVDVIFDAGENEKVPGFWYWDELNRHVLCLTIDSAMSRDAAKKFWASYLDDDMDGIIDSLNLVAEELKATDPALAVQKVIDEAFAFARNNPAKFTLTHRTKRKGYQQSSPNVAAFTQLFQAIHTFAAHENSLPEHLIHDKQDEFRKALAETYANFGKIIWQDTTDGSFPRATVAEYDLAKFEILSSKDNCGLQATDLLLWTIQRKPKTTALSKLRDRVKAKTDGYYISRRMSELVVHMHLLRHERERARKAD